MKIAIIGMGVSGISVLREWTKQKKVDPSVNLTVFGEKDTFGTGPAYQKDDVGLLMNQPARLTSMIPEDTEDFIEWMERNYGEEDGASKFYPRAHFGEYVTERMKGWLAESNARIIQEKVETIRMLPNNRFQITSSSHTADFDAVHLCIGNLPYQDPYDLKNHPNAIMDPFPTEKKISQIPRGSKVGVLGTGVTSIDIFRYIFAHRPDIDVAFFSHSGTFKSIIGEDTSVANRYFTKENIKRTKEKYNGFIPLEIYIEWFKKELVHQQLSDQSTWMNEQQGSQSSIKSQLNDSSEIGIIQTVLNNMDMILTDIWMALTEADKEEFMHTYFKKWDKLRSPFPPATGKDLIYAWETGRIHVYDTLVDIEEKDASFACKLENEESIHVDYMMNATGNDIYVSHDMDEMPLLGRLVNERILQAERFGGVQVSAPDLSTISQAYGVFHTLKVHGQLISGIQFGNNSVRILSSSAQQAVQDMVQQLTQRA